MSFVFKFFALKSYKIRLRFSYINRKTALKVNTPSHGRLTLRNVSKKNKLHPVGFSHDFQCLIIDFVRDSVARLFLYYVPDTRNRYCKKNKVDTERETIGK